MNRRIRKKREKYERFLTEYVRLYELLMREAMLRHINRTWTLNPEIRLSPDRN